MPFVTVSGEFLSQETIPYKEIFDQAVLDGNAGLAMAIVRNSLGDNDDTCIFHVTQTVEGTDVIDRYRNEALTLIFSGDNSKELVGRNVELLLDLYDYQSRKMNFPPDSQSVVAGAFANVKQLVYSRIKAGDEPHSSMINETKSILDGIFSLIRGGNPITNESLVKALNLCRVNSLVTWETSELRLVYISVERYLLGVQSRIFQQGIPRNRIESILTGSN